MKNYDETLLEDQIRLYKRLIILWRVNTLGTIYKALKSQI